MARIIIAVICALELAAAVLLGAGCHGKILVDHPEVFTRERLVARRFAEVEWLNGKLDEPLAADDFQGMRDVRVFESLVGRLGLTMNPVQGQLESATLARDLAGLRQESQLTAMQHQLDMARLEKTMQSITPALAGDQVGAGGGDSSAANAARAEAAQKAAQKAAEEAAKSALEAKARFLKEDERPDLPDPGKIEPTKARVTGVERLRDEMGYRDAVQAALREQELDDTHDLAGYTLYTLKFDISVLPQGTERALGKVRLEVEAPQDGGSVWERLFDRKKAASAETKRVARLKLFKEWLRVLQADMGREALAMQRRCAMGYPSEEELILLAMQGDEGLQTIGPFKKEADRKVEDDEKAKKAEKEEKAEKAEKGRTVERDVNLKAAADVVDTEPSRWQVRAKELSTVMKALETPIKVTSREPGGSCRADENMGKKLGAIVLARYVRGGLERIVEPDDEPIKEVTIEGVVYYLPKIKGVDDREDEAGFRAFLIEFRGYLEAFWSIDTEPKNIAQELRGRLNSKAMTPKDFLILIEEYRSEQPKYLPQLLDGYKKKNPQAFLGFLDGRERAPMEFSSRLKLDAPESDKSLMQPYVYAVGPKELAQNISEVAAKEQLLNMILALSAVMPGASGTLDMNYLSRWQSVAHGINRKPLVVGFAEKDAFGWILGPRFEVADGKVQFSHTQAQHSVQATIAVPAWLDEITLKGEYSWGGSWPTSFWGGGLFSDCVREWKWLADLFGGTPLKVRLPRDLSALTRALLSDSGSQKPRPYIEPRWSADGKQRPQVMLTAGEKGTLLIRGSDLWRNPAVFIGSQRADKVEILPDMGGLLAHFEKEVAMPATVAGGEARVDLTVVTSVNAAVLRDAVLIQPGGSEKDVVGLYKVKEPFGYPGGSITVVLDPETPLKAYSAVQVCVRPRGLSQPPEWQILDATVALSGKEVTAKLPTADKAPKLFTVNQKAVEVDLRVVLSPGAEPIGPPAGRTRPTFAWFISKESSVPTLAAKPWEYTVKEKVVSVTTAPSLSITLCDLEVFYAAYPGLESALQAGFKLVLTKGEDSVAVAIKREFLKVERNAPAATLTVKSDPIGRDEKFLNMLKGDTQTFTLELDYGGASPLPLGSLVVKKKP